MARKINKMQEFVENHFRANINAPIDELTDFAELYCAKPDIKKLIRQHFRNMTNRTVRKIKNDDGSRRIYADRHNDVYSDIEQETSLEVLANIRNDHKVKLSGNHKAYKLVTTRMAELSGQTLLEFEKNETNIIVV